MRMPQGAEWLIILLLIMVLFGAKRLPDAARGLGRSLRILKAETKGLRDDESSEPVTDITEPAPKQVSGSPAGDEANRAAVPNTVPPPAAGNHPA